MSDSHQVSVSGKTYARLVAESTRRGNGVRTRGGVIAIVEESLAGDWNGALARTRRIGVTLAAITLNGDSKVIGQLDAIDAPKRTRAIDRAIHRALAPATATDWTIEDIYVVNVVNRWPWYSRLWNRLTRWYPRMWWPRRKVITRPIGMG